MTIVNACLGGLANAVPAGQAVLNLTWITNDGENQQVTYSISGASTKSVQSDANGYASVQLPVGAYSVAVVHGGEYLGDDPKSVTLTSRGTFALTWLTGSRNAQVVTFNSPYALTSSTVSYAISLGGTTVESGKSWSTSMTFNLYGGDYTLTLGVYGTSTTYAFTVPKNAGIVRDLSALFSTLSVNISGGYELKNVTINGYTAPDTASYASLHTVAVLRNKTVSVGCTMDYTADIPTFSGAISGAIYSVSPGKKSVTPSDATYVVSIDIVKKGIKQIITYESLGEFEFGTITVPSARYKIMCVGGGGGGGACRWGIKSGAGAGGGGGSGYIAIKTASLSGAYSLRLGAGGRGAEEDTEPTNGGVTSFGSVLSASGGGVGYSGESIYSGGAGGAGGTGGGGGAVGRDVNNIGGDGGAGDYGGGGGGSAYSANHTPTGGAGGAGGSNGSSGSAGVTRNTMPTSDIADFDGASGGSAKSSAIDELFEYTPKGGEGGGLAVGRTKSDSTMRYVSQWLGGQGGSSPFGGGGKSVRSTTTNSSYYQRATSGGYGAGGGGGPSNSGLWMGYYSTNGGYGGTGVIALIYMGD